MLPDDVKASLTAIEYYECDEDIDVEKNSSSLIWSKSTTKADRSEFTVLSRRSEMREANYRRTANDVSESNRPQTVHDDDICPSAWQLTAGQWSVRVTGQASAADR